MFEKGEMTGGNGYTTGAADALIAAAPYNDYLVFTDAQSWYRLDIGARAVGETNTNYGVLRGKAYTAAITNITGPGLPNEEDLFEEPEKPVDAKTYINVTIEAKGWEAIYQWQDL